VRAKSDRPAEPESQQMVKNGTFVSLTFPA
jgi:hypothetical protein